MTRTDVVASSRPQKAGAAPNRKGWARASRRLLVALAALALAMGLAVPVASAAEEGLTGYTTTTTTTTTTTPTTTSTPTTTTTPTTTSTPATTPTPTSGTSPEKESSTPTKTTAPEKASAEPAKSTEPTAKKASTLPFTGFDLRWLIGGGLLLIAMGFSIVTAQRRQRGGTGSGR